MHQIERAKRRGGEVLRQNSLGSLEYLTFPSLTQTGVVKHLFTTRTGGVSTGIFESLNLNFQRGDDPEKVLENYKRVAQVLSCSVEDMVLSQQTHTTNIRLVKEQDKGKGIVRPQDYTDVDGLITDKEGLILVTSYADCVPLYFVDPVRRAVGLAHSGWRGTVAGMGRHMVQAMEEHFGSKPEDLYTAIGPSICQDCYEVSREVADAFWQLFEEDGDIVEEILESGYRGGYEGRAVQVVAPGRESGKYQLDLWLANAVILRKAGVPVKQIAITDICTCHNSDYLFSHRASRGKRGNVCAFLGLQETGHC